MSELILWKDEEMHKLRRDIDRLFDRCRSEFGVCRFLGEVSEGFSGRSLRMSIPKIWMFPSPMTHS